MYGCTAVTAFDPIGVYSERWGKPREDYSAMRYPMRHVACGRVHDASAVEVLERYSDCSRWKCPHCGGWCDDRPLGWGGTVERVGHERGNAGRES